MSYKIQYGQVQRYHCLPTKLGGSTGLQGRGNRSRGRESWEAHLLPIEQPTEQDRCPRGQTAPKPIFEPTRRVIDES